MPYVNISPQNCFDVLLLLLLVLFLFFDFFFCLLVIGFCCFVCTLYVCVCVYHVYSVPMKASKGPLGSLELKLQVILSHLILTVETKPGFSGKAVSAFNYRAKPSVHNTFAI